MVLSAVNRMPTRRALVLWLIPLALFVLLSVKRWSSADADLLSTIATVVAALLVMSLIMPMARRHQGAPQRAIWRWLLLAVASDVAATVAWGVLHANSSMPYGSWVDAIYLVYYPATAAACLLMFRLEGGSPRDLPLWLDAIAFALGLLAMLWLIVFGQQPALDRITTGSIYTAGAYGLGDALTMATAAALAMQVGHWRARKSTLLFLLSVVCTLATDTAWITAQVHGADTASTLANVGYCLHYSLLGTAAAIERHRPVSVVPQLRRATSYNYLPIVALLMGMVLLASTTLNADHSPPPWLALTIIVGGVVAIGRQMLMRKDFEKLQDALARQQADRRLSELVQGAEDLLCVISPEEMITYVSPAAERILGSKPNSLLGIPGIDLLGPSRQLELQGLLSRARAAPGWPQTLEITRKAVGEDIQYLKVTACVASANSMVEGTCLAIRDISNTKRLEHKLRSLAYYDSLTGLANRSLFYDSVVRAIQTVGESGKRVAVLFIDLDNFKSVNDGLGHGAGDSLLRACARRLEELVATAGLVARLGGDEFAVLLDHVENAPHALAIGRHVVETLSPPVVVDGRELRVGASVGVYVADCPTRVEDVLRGADAAMYRAKLRGKGHAVLFDPEMAAAARRRLFMEQDLAVAVERNELALVYQPIVELETGHLLGVEALVRWHHASLGLVLPGDFIQVAEETGLIVPITEWILNRACEDVVQLKAALPQAAGVRLSINLSGRCLQDATFVQIVETALNRNKLDAESLVLEITESVLLKDSGELNERVGELHSLGIRLALDDFGTGFSSLSYLQRFALDVLKIDKSFVQELSSSNALRRREADTMIRAMLSIADSLGLETIAEGVEDDTQRISLLRLGCKIAQGFAFGRPMPINEVYRCTAAKRREWMVNALPAKVDFSASGRFLLSETSVSRRKSEQKS